MELGGPVCSGPSPQTVPAEAVPHAAKWSAVRAGEAVLYGWIEAVREHLQDSILDDAAHANPDSEVAANLQLQVVDRRIDQYVHDVRTQHAPMIAVP